MKRENFKHSLMTRGVALMLLAGMGNSIAAGTCTPANTLTAAQASVVISAASVPGVTLTVADASMIVGAATVPGVTLDATQAAAVVAAASVPGVQMDATATAVVLAAASTAGITLTAEQAILFANGYTDGQVAEVKSTVAALDARVVTVEGKVATLETTVADHGTRLTAVEGSVATLQSDIVALNTAVASKANAADVYTKSEVDTKLANVSVDLSAYAKSADVATAVAGLAIKSEVTTQITEATKDLATKQSVTDLSDVVNTKVTAAQVATQIEAYGYQTATQVNNAIDAKISGLATSESVAAKADKSYVDSTFATKSDLTSTNTRINNLEVYTGYVVGATINLDERVSALETSVASSSVTNSKGNPVAAIEVTGTSIENSVTKVNTGVLKVGENGVLIVSANADANNQDRITTDGRSTELGGTGDLHLGGNGVNVRVDGKLYVQGRKEDVAKTLNKHEKHIATAEAIAFNVLADELTPDSWKQEGVGFNATVAGNADTGGTEVRVGVSKSLGDGWAIGAGVGTESGAVSANISKSIDITENFKVAAGASVSESGVSFGPSAMLHKDGYGVGMSTMGPEVMVAGHTIPVAGPLMVPNIIVTAATGAFKAVTGKTKAEIAELKKEAADAKAETAALKAEVEEMKAQMAALMKAVESKKK